MTTFANDQAASFSNPVDLKALREVVCDTSKRLIVVAGAGISMNASLPSWDDLVTKMAALIKDPALRRMIEADRSDAMRKAGMILNLLCEDSTSEPHEFVRDALYHPGLVPAPGQLALSVARLVKARNGNVQLLTTNYDNLLEQALKCYFRESDIKPFSLDEVDEWENWHKTGKIGVLHLHGLLCIRPHLRKEPVIITESQFLEHGPRVRERISDTLAESNALFVGLGMADPNLVEPLYRRRTPAHAQRFALVVPKDAPGSNGDAADSARYAYISAKYLETELGLRPIFVQSYSELNQTVSDLSLAIVEPDRYKERPADKSLIYRRRFNRTLEVCYRNLGCGTTGQVPDKAAAIKLNGKLFEALKIPVKAINELRRARGASDSEKFALFLWLRTRRPGGGGDPPYSLNLVGSSAYVHREGWSMRRVEQIVGNCKTAAVHAVYTGTLIVTNMDRSRQEWPWQGVVAAPIILEGWCSKSKVGEHAADVLTIGAITLNSTRKVVVEDQPSTQHDYSVLNQFNSADFNKLMTSMQTAAEHVLRSP